MTTTGPTVSIKITHRERVWFLGMRTVTRTFDNQPDALAYERQFKSEGKIR